MKHFIIKTLIFSILPLITLVAINLYSDPAYLFKQGKIEKQISDYILKGHNVYRITNLNERLLQKYIIENTPDTIDKIVLGTSRGMLIDKTMVSKQNTFFNHSVSGGTLEDFLGIYDLYLQQEKAPVSIILELSPWLLNDNNPSTRWKTLQPNYQDILQELHLSSFFNICYFTHVEYLELISPSYFQKSYQNLISNNHIQQESILTISPDSTKNTIFSDGSRMYNKEFNQIDSVALSTLQTENIGKFIYWEGFNQFHTLSKNRQQIFEQFIQYLKQKNTELLFLLAPFHPLVYDQLKELYPIDEVEKYFYSIAQKSNIKIIGSYNPHKYNFSIYDFHDGMHPRKRVYQELLCTE